MPLFCLILDFLHDLYTKPYRYSSLNTVRSAISALYSIDKTDVGQNIGKHPLICRFLNSVFNVIPPTPKFQEVWPVKQVLAYLEQFTPLHGFKVEGTYVETSHAYCSSNWIEMPSFLIFRENTWKRFQTNFTFSLSGHHKTNQVTCLAMCACFSTRIKVFTLHLNIILKLRSHNGRLQSCLCRILSLIMKSLVLR